MAELVNLKQALHIFQECWITWKKFSARRILLLSGIHHFIHWYLHRAASIHLNPGILSWASIFFSSSLFPREQSACPLNRVAPNSRAGDSCQPSLCLQASTRSETRANTGMTQIQTTAWAQEKTQDMLVCNLHCAIVLISRRDKLKSVAPDCLVP